MRASRGPSGADPGRSRPDPYRNRPPSVENGSHHSRCQPASHSASVLPIPAAKTSRHRRILGQVAVAHDLASASADMTATRDGAHGTRGELRGKCIFRAACSPDKCAVGAVAATAHTDPMTRDEGRPPRSLRRSRRFTAAAPEANPTRRHGGWRGYRCASRRPQPAGGGASSSTIVSCRSCPTRWQASATPTPSPTSSKPAPPGCRSPRSRPLRTDRLRRLSHRVNEQSATTHAPSFGRRQDLWRTSFLPADSSAVGAQRARSTDGDVLPVRWTSCG